jgi:hypothetical protein
LASIINASNSGFGGIVSTGDSSGQLALQAAGTTVATIQSTGLNLGSNGVVFSDSSSQTAAASPYVLKNRIINGDMRIDQRNAGASVTPTAIATWNYTLDRWAALISVTSKFSVQQNAGSVTPPVGFTNYLGVTSLSSYSVASGDYFWLEQPIEGYNIADLAYGTANAKTITLSFWVRSSLTGTFGGSLTNAGNDYAYPFTYTISSANTWEQKSVTIAGPTAGTWNTTNSQGIRVRFGLGVGTNNSGTAGSWAAVNYVSATGATSVVGTNGATFYITGVQLEIGSTATPFERRLYGQELLNCQRYFWMLTADTGNTTPFNAVWYNSKIRMAMTCPVMMRTTPTVTASGTLTNFFFATNDDAAYTNFTISSTYGEQNRSTSTVGFTGTSSGASGGAQMYIQNSRSFTASAEL